MAACDAVVVGGAIYSGRWHRDVLGRRPVWMFSSGPLDASAATTDIPPVPMVQSLMEDVGARAHVTGQWFPGSGRPGWKARRQAGDWRDDDHIVRWGHEIAAALLREQALADG